MRAWIRFVAGFFGSRATLGDAFASAGRREWIASTPVERPTIRLPRCRAIEAQMTPLERTPGTPPRFERSHESQGICKLFSRDEVAPHLEYDAACEPGLFLACLWPHFGPPESCDDGFQYDIVDRQTGLGFTAYSGASGPSYGGPMRGEEALRPVLEAFEAMLATTQPVDCEVTFSADEEYGGGKCVLGFRDGRPFMRAKRK
jgi:hypothetical protein